jgi:hypothetical protein
MDQRNQWHHHNAYTGGPYIVGPDQPGVPPVTYQGWGVVNYWPMPPPRVRADRALSRVWKQDLAVQYGTSDASHPHRYLRAWQSYFSTPAGELWNGYPHFPVWGPHQARPLTQADDICAQNAANYFTQARQNMTGEQKLQAQYSLVLTAVTGDGHSFSYPFYPRR